MSETKNVFITCIIVLIVCANVDAQTKKPTRAKPPVFKPGQFDGIFFPDATSVLKGKLPDSQAAIQASVPKPIAPPAGGADDGDPLAWHNLISPIALEDLIKGSKLRLDKLVTTPAAFAGGGFQEARKEFSLQSLLFAIIETHPGDVRWKQSAGVIRESTARAAANTKIGSRQVFDEAKKRLLDLSDLMNGSQLAGEAKTEIDWSKLIDRAPLMQLLDWAEKDYVSTFAGSEARFNDNAEELQRYAELIAVLGKASVEEEMPDASDDEYQAFAKDMIVQAQAVVLAVQTKNAEAARQAAGKLNQSCTNCHDNFR